MPMVNGKKFAYTPKGKAAAKKAADDYQRDEKGNFKLDEYGDMMKAIRTPSAKAERNRSKLRGAGDMDRKIAKQKAIRTMLRNPIPASPTR